MCDEPSSPGYPSKEQLGGTGEGECPVLAEGSGGSQIRFAVMQYLIIFQIVLLSVFYVCLRLKHINKILTVNIVFGISSWIKFGENNKFKIKRNIDSEKKQIKI